LKAFGGESFHQRGAKRTALPSTREPPEGSVKPGGAGGGASTLVGKPVELCGIQYSRVEVQDSKCVLIFDEIVMTDYPVVVHTQSVQQGHRYTQQRQRIETGLYFWLLFVVCLLRSAYHCPFYCWLVLYPTERAGLITIAVIRQRSSKLLQVYTAVYSSFVNKTPLQDCLSSLLLIDTAVSY
jgi:hypothetical protein